MSAGLQASVDTIGLDFPVQLIHKSGPLVKMTETQGSAEILEILETLLPYMVPGPPSMISVDPKVESNSFIFGFFYDLKTLFRSCYNSISFVGTTTTKKTKHSLDMF